MQNDVAGMTSRSWLELVEEARAAESAGELELALHEYEAAFRELSTEHSPAESAELMRCIAVLHMQRGALDLAAEAYETSLAIADASGLQQHTTAALIGLAQVAQTRGDIDGAEANFTEAKYIAGELSDDRLAATIDQSLGALAILRGDVDFAVLNYRSALGRLRRLADTRACALTLKDLGLACVELKDWETSEGCFDDAFDLADGLRDTALLGAIELSRAKLYLARRDFLRSRDCCDRAFEICKRLDSSAALANAYRFYGVLYREMQRPGLAESHFEQAVELAVRAGDQLLEADALSEWAQLEVQAGRNKDALRRLNRAHRLFNTVRTGPQAAAIEQRLDQLEHSYLQVVQQWAESIESKDNYTAGHCPRVVEYACKLAEAAGFAGRELTWFRMGAFLHDVGKTEVPAEVLNKPGKLTAEEWKVMQRHTIAGAEIVDDLSFPWDVRAIVRNHHERWDGTGYPDRMAGEQIPLTARILCLADVFDALTTARSYRPALSRQEALRIMERDAGIIFDPQLFATFKAIVANALEAAA